MAEISAGVFVGVDRHVTRMTPHPMSAADWDDAFRAASDRKRRRLLLELWRLGPEAGAVPTRELDGLSSEHDRLKLRHVHLPMLDDVGYVRWDRERGTVERGPRFEDVVPLVEWFRERLRLGRPA